MQKITINKILKKKNKIPLTCLTAYSKTIAKIANLSTKPVECWSN